MTPLPILSSGQLVLVTGPARSGKSAWAEALAAATHQPVLYIATAQRDPTDLEWQARIEAHRHRRPDNWQTQEVPISLAQTLDQATPDTCLLIDSLGTWLANLIDQDTDEWERTTQALLTSLEQTSATVIMVAEETGWGVIPAYPVGRTFRDRLGQLTQAIARQAHYTYLVTAGFALNLKVLGTFIPASLGSIAAVSPNDSELC